MLHQCPHRFRCLPILLMLCSTFCWAGETMKWLIRDIPPASILENGKPGEGVTDKTLKLVVARWPEAEHQFVLANNKRTWEVIAKGEEFCDASSLITPERQKIAYFTPAYLTAPLQLVTHTKFVSKLPLNAAGEVRMDELLRQFALTGLLVEGRSYGQMLDALIAARPAGEGLHWANRIANVPKMIALQRADWTIEYGGVLTYHRSLDQDLAGVVGLPIEGNAQAMVSGFACPRTPWGRAAIMRIDKILSDPDVIAATRVEVTRWQSPETKRRYAQQLDEFYRRRARPTDPSLFR